MRHAAKQMMKCSDTLLELMLRSQLTDTDIKALVYAKRQMEKIAAMLNVQLDASKLSDAEFEAKYGMRKDGTILDNPDASA